MQQYVVGGAVRDALLGLPEKDRDWVVVGATPEDMLARGFRPVGKDFPVFLHPETHEEYALARTERKTGRGYAGFTFHTTPDITLEEDLFRRDLTINAIARDEEGNLIDPYCGQQDLQSKILRHVSTAFAEDPVRILRIARFAARFTDFTIAPETEDLMRTMVANGEVDHLVAERIWQELSRGLMENRPSRMIHALRACGALARLLPELDRLFGIPQPEKHHPEIDTGKHVMMVIDQAATAGQPLAVRWACLLHDLGKGDTPADTLPHHYGHEQRSAELAYAVSTRLKAPADCRELAVLVAREHGALAHALEMRPATLVTVLERCDAIRRPERFDLLLSACACDHFGRGNAPSPISLNQATPLLSQWPPAIRLQNALIAVRTVDAGAIARHATDKHQIPTLLHAARVAAVKRAEEIKTPVQT